MRSRRLLSKPYGPWWCVMAARAGSHQRRKGFLSLAGQNVPRFLELFHGQPVFCGSPPHIPQPLSLPNPSPHLLLGPGSMRKVGRVRAGLPSSLSSLGLAALHGLVCHVWKQLYVCTLSGFVVVCRRPSPCRLICGGQAELTCIFTEPRGQRTHIDRRHRK